MAARCASAHQGAYAKSTSFSLRALGAQELMRPEGVEAFRTQRRDDLQGKPLAWQKPCGNS